MASGKALAGIAAVGAGQEIAKKLIQEVVVWPLMNPTIFTVSVCSRAALPAGVGVAPLCWPLPCARTSPRWRCGACVC